MTRALFQVVRLRSTVPVPLSHDAADDAPDACHERRAQRSKGAAVLSQFNQQDSQDQPKLRESQPEQRGAVKSSEQSVRDLYQEPKCQIRQMGAELGVTLEEGYIQEVFKMFEGERLFLLEVACSTDSLLTQEALEKGMLAERASLFNGHDLTTPEGLWKTLDLIRMKRPRNIWISTECGHHSELQPENGTTKERPERQTKAGSKTTHNRWFGGGLFW